jgi:hypothetical protein
MSDLSGPYPGQQPPLPPSSPTPDKPPSSDIPGWVLYLAAMVVISLIGLVFYAVTDQGGNGDSPAAGTPSATAFPGHWDKRIAPYARIAARERGLSFRHPVPVRFLAPRAFAKKVTQDSDDLSKDDRADIANSTGLLRAFGLISGNVDLFKSVNRFSGGGVLAYYSYEDQRITVRGHVVTPAMKSTLVHELTHVLQDQHFHIGDRMKQLRKDGKDTASSVLDAIIEGDARRVQTRYRASLTAQQRAALDAAQRKESAAGQHRISDVPPALVSILTSPYTLGEALTETVAANGGNAAVDRLFRHPPTHETVLLDPYRVLSHQTGARHVAVPGLGTGEKKFDSGELGVVTWYFMLGERLPLTDALAAADGWGGDAYVGYHRGGTSCVRASFVGRTPADTTRMYTDLQRWIADGSASTASVTRDGSALRFQTCDPGTDDAAGPDTTEQAMELVATRAGIAIGISRSGVPAGAAHCIAGRLIQDYPVSDLVDPSFGASDPTVQAHIQQIAVECR